MLFMGLISCIIKPDFIGIISSLLIHGIYLDKGSPSYLDKLNNMWKILLIDLLYEKIFIILNFLVIYHKIFYFELN